MSVLIRGFEMPTNCAKCKLFGEYGCPFIGAVGSALTKGRRSLYCPLVPVPLHTRGRWKRKDAQVLVFFSHRIELERAFYAWAKEHGAAEKPNAFLAFLQMNGLLNAEKVIEWCRKRRQELSKECKE